MNAIELFEQLGVLHKVRWKSTSGYTARIDERKGDLVHYSVELPFVGTWIPDKPTEMSKFLGSHTPDRKR